MIEVLKQAYQLLLTEPHAPTVCDQLEVIFRQAIAGLESQEPVAWKLMPRDATDSMLKAMDECSTEGYDERLYAGHAASVYMAAWDASDTQPPQLEQNFCPRCGKRTNDIHTCTPPQKKNNG
jgi:hypothetical protein